ncbi:unnamed protein product [Triticum aestivum]|uniref:Protein FAR1-RELATED SEQUENCE n=3 Tax=Triticinae TaxID=1648030 RepID=A0A453BGK9_AEGTS|nr:uncharacterized protein LOC109774282 isoform X1 [Aegilops tauschii subsp. strangulata]SPT17732.1 unnamed protein product [Triticum aestivum]
MKQMANTNASANSDHTGLFCHHIIALLEHLRVAIIPDRYILQRYTRDANSDSAFNHRDYRNTTVDGTLIQYRHTKLLNETLKTVQKGVKTDAAYNRLMTCLKQVQPELDDLNGDDIESTECKQSSVDENEVAPDMAEQKDPTIEKSSMDDDRDKIHPPPVCKTKGRNKLSAAMKQEQKPTEISEKISSKTARPEPVIGKDGMPLGSRLCSNCNMISGHNKRTCVKRQLEQKLLQAHEKKYGPVDKSMVAATIKKLLSKATMKEEAINDSKNMSDDSNEKGGSDEDAEPSPKRMHINKDVGKGKIFKKRCKKCNKVEGHNTRTCDVVRIGNEILEMTEQMVHQGQDEACNRKHKTTSQKLAGAKGG